MNQDRPTRDELLHLISQPICFRCGKRRERAEGSEVPVASAIGGQFLFFHVICSFVPMNLSPTILRFVCHACQRRRRRIQIALWGTLGFVMLLALLLECMGVI